MGKRVKVRLRDPGTCFTDPESAFHISGSEVKPLPKRPGTILQARIRHGGLVIADDPPKKKSRKSPPAGGDEKPAESPAAEKSAEPPKRAELIAKAKGLPGFKVTLSNDELVKLVESAQETGKE